MFQFEWVKIAPIITKDSSMIDGSEQSYIQPIKVEKDTPLLKILLLFYSKASVRSVRHSA